MPNPEIRHAHRGLHFFDDEEAVMAEMIGSDPHKGSHTAVALDDREESLGELRVRSSANQAEQVGMRPLVLDAEIDGFVADRLLEAMLREAL